MGRDLQKLAQRNLFGPIGIERSSYLWLRDRSGHTYGYANLFIAPTQYAKLGLLMQNDAVWRGHRLLSARYVRQLREPTKTSGCYGMLFWVNGGKSCTGANIPAAQTLKGPLVASAPPDMHAMVGALQQSNFIVPSLNMLVSWTGYLGDTTRNLSALLSAHGTSSDLYYRFFRLLMKAVQDVNVKDPGPFRQPPPDLHINPINYLSPHVLLRDLFASPTCNIVFCDDTVPYKGALANLSSVLGLLC